MSCHETDGLSTYVVSSLWLPKANVLAGQANNVTLFVHDACSCTAGTDIDTDVVLHLHSELVVWINRHLSRLLSALLPVRLAKWH